MKLEELKAYRDDIIAIADRYHAPNIRVFGSVARGEATAESNVNFLIDVSSKQTLFDLAYLKNTETFFFVCQRSRSHFRWVL